MRKGMEADEIYERTGIVRTAFDMYKNVTATMKEKVV